MLVMVKSAPDTPEGKRGVKLAQDMGAHLVLLQNGVYFVQKERFKGFCSKVYVLDEDMRLRGIRGEDIEKGIKTIDYDGLVDLMADEDKVIGIF